MNAKQAELKHNVSIDILERAPFQKKITANSDECAVIAKRLGIVELHEFEADFRITRDKNAAIFYVEAVLKADVTMSCSRTNQEFREMVGASVEELFTTNPALAGQDDTESLENMMDEGDIDGLMAELEKPFMVKDSTLDIGEMAVQFLSLCIPEYPLMPELRGENDDDEEFVPVFQDKDDVILAEGDRIFPFANLKDMIEGKKKG